MQAVREALRIPVLANGNIRTLHDVEACLAYTGAAGVMSADSLLEDPGLFSPVRLQPDGAKNHLTGCYLLLEYLQLTEEYSTHPRMIRGHAFKLLGKLTYFPIHPLSDPALWAFLCSCCSLKRPCSSQDTITKAFSSVFPCLPFSSLHIRLQTIAS